MSDGLGMAISNSLEKDFTNIAGFFLVVERFGYDAIEKFSALHLFGNEVIIRRLLVYIIKSDNVFVFEFIEYVNFVLKCDFVFFSEFGLGNNLNSVMFVRAAFSGLNYYREGPFP
jgi:hypothetical protein